MTEFNKLSADNKLVERSKNGKDKLVFWLYTEIKTPPFSENARLTAGYFIRKLQQHQTLTMPDLRVMPSIGERCCELRIPDGDKTWRIICRIDENAILILSIFPKKTRTTPKKEIDLARSRLKIYEKALKG